MLKKLYAVIPAVQIGGMVRTLISPLISGAVMFAVGKKWIAPSDAAEIIAVLITLFVTLSMAAWSAQTNTAAAMTANVKEIPNTVVVQTAPGTDTANVAQAVSQIPNVDKVLATQAIADASPSAKVVAV